MFRSDERWHVKGPSRHTCNLAADGGFDLDLDDLARRDATSEASLSRQFVTLAWSGLQIDRHLEGGLVLGRSTTRATRAWSWDPGVGYVGNRRLACGPPETVAITAHIQHYASPKAR